MGINMLTAANGFMKRSSFPLCYKTGFVSILKHAGVSVKAQPRKPARLMKSMSWLSILYSFDKARRSRYNV